MYIATIERKSAYSKWRKHVEIFYRVVVYKVTPDIDEVIYIVEHHNKKNAKRNARLNTGFDGKFVNLNKQVS